MSLVKFKPGDQVAQVVPVIKGEVKRFSFDPEEGKVSYVVGWTDENGTHERTFDGDELEPNTDITKEL